MSEFIIELPNGGAADECIRLHGYEKSLYGYELREEIVRCRDCRHGYEVEWPKSWNIPADYLDCTGELVETWDYYNDRPNSNPVKPDGFCAWGERTEEWRGEGGAQWIA